MGKLNLGACMTVEILARQHVAQCEIARLLGVSKAAVRYQIWRMEAGAVGGISEHGRWEVGRVSPAVLATVA
ncbi:MAG: hypothetical protein KIS79_00500 [Burkholderiales bacterium]|nr:hypothetical protein [Burkholderiales bacterium]